MAYRITIEFTEETWLALLLADVDFMNEMKRRNGGYNGKGISMRDMVENNNEGTARWLVLQLIGAYSLRILSITGVDLQRDLSTKYAHVAVRDMDTGHWVILCKVVEVTKE